MAEQMTILEAAARAICEANGYGPNSGKVPPGGDELWPSFESEARAALTTLGLTAEQMEQPVGSWVLVPVGLLNEVVGDAEAAAEAQYPPNQREQYPSIAADFDRDMAPVRAIRALMAARPGAKEANHG